MNELVGYVATILGIISLILQTYHTIKKRQYIGLSISRIICDITGCILWVVYGILINSMPIIISSGFIVLMNIIILVLYIYDTYITDNSDELSELLSSV